LVFNSELSRKKFFASKINRKPIYNTYFYPKGTKSKYDSSIDISGLKKHNTQMIQIPNKRDLLNPHKIITGNKKDFDRIMDNLYDPHHARGKKGNSKVIITGANQYFKPHIVTNVELDEMVSRQMQENYLHQIMAENQGKDISKLKTAHGFPLTNAGLIRQRKAMHVGVIPLNPKKH